ncbi:MAG: translation initiation factor IF-2 [Desulfovibrio sp.]|nr:translation initiation factor IF-2 [Desulfovibrio sp.]
MRARRTLFLGMTIAAMLGASALPPVTVTGGAAYATENSPAPPVGQDNTPADDSPSASKPGPLPLISPISYSAQCPAAPLPPHVQRLCAEAAAQMEALHAAAARLPNRRDIRMGITDADDRTALAAELYTPLIEGEHSTAGSAQSTGAQGVTVTLLARPDAAETLLRLLRNPDVLALRRLLLADMAQSLALAPQIAGEYAAAESPARGGRTSLTPGSGGTWYVAKVTPPGELEQHPPAPIMPDAGHEAARQQAQARADNLAAEITACLSALDALRLSPEGWLTSAEALPTLENAAAALPRSAAVQLLLAEAQLQAGMPQRSILSCSAALDLAPALARGRYIRSLAHWRLQQMGLAEDDLSAALNTTDETFLRTPDRVRLLRARGALRMLRNNAEGMCSDLTAACALGDCEGLAAARNQQLCTGQPAGDASPAPEVPSPAASPANTSGKVAP